jgi:hypothetical protein
MERSGGCCGPASMARADGVVRYRRSLLLQPHAPALQALAARRLSFEYEQDLQTLAMCVVARQDAAS